MYYSCIRVGYVKKQEMRLYGHAYVTVCDPADPRNNDLTVDFVAHWF